MERKFLAYDNCLHVKCNTSHLTVNAISFPFILLIVKPAWICSYDIEFCEVKSGE